MQEKVPIVPSSRITGEVDQVDPYEQFDALFFIQPFKQNAVKERKIHGLTPLSPPRKNNEITPTVLKGSRTNHRTVFNKWNTSYVRS